MKQRKAEMKAEMQATFKSAKPGRFLPGNRFWEARSKHGRDKIFTSPQILAEACAEYFQWCEDNPLFEVKAFMYEGVITQEPMPKMRAMSIRGLCIFLDITEKCWWDYAARDEFSEITSKVKHAIDEQKFTGASAGLLVASIIARDLGLAEKKEVSGPGGAPIRTITTDMDPKEAAAAYRAALEDDEQ